MKKVIFVLLMGTMLYSCDAKKQAGEKEPIMQDEKIDETQERDKTSVKAGPPSDNDYGAVTNDSANTINAAEGLE